MAPDSTLRQLRKVHKMTLLQASRLIGCSPGNLSRIENGRQRVTVRRCRQLAALYNVTIGKILELNDRAVQS